MPKGIFERKRIPLRTRFMSHIPSDKTVDECWEWLGTIDSYGYGVIGTFDGDKPKSIKAHRLAYQYAHGEINPDMLVCHTCDNRRCVNPKHLYQGTVLDNNRDITEHGRRYDQRGENNPGAVLTWDKVREIRYLNLKEHLSTSELCRIFGASNGAIHAVITGRTWKE